jgi:hypothetical protein
MIVEVRITIDADIQINIHKIRSQRLLEIECDTSFSRGPR